jgi:hypothetical protein
MLGSRNYQYWPGSQTSGIIQIAKVSTAWLLIVQVPAQSRVTDPCAFALPPTILE